MKLFEKFPPDLLLRSLLQRGAGFKAEYECLNEGPKPRFFFVANLSPETDDKLILFTSTTQEEKRRAHHGSRADEVLVVLEPSTYPDISQRCVIDCESPVKRTRSVFEQQATSRLYTPVARLPEEYQEAISAAVRNARTLSAAEKRLVLGEPDRLPNSEDNGPMG